MLPHPPCGVRRDGRTSASYFFFEGPVQQSVGSHIQPGMRSYPSLLRARIEENAQRLGNVHDCTALPCQGKCTGSDMLLLLIRYQALW